MRKLAYGMNLTLDGYVAAPGDDIGWSRPSDELFEWWLEEERAIGLLLYGRRLWEAMSSYWPTALWGIRRTKSPLAASLGT